MTQKTAAIAVLGAPNAGKSTLVNQLVGSKVSIVTPKAQTTRAIIRGIAMQGAAQFILLDTPGIFRPTGTLDRAMVKSAWDALGEADFQMLVVDANKGITDKVKDILEGMKRREVPAILVLNKVDLISPAELLPLSSALNEAMNFDRTFMISAITGNGTKDLLKYLEEKAPEQPWIYPEDQVATAPMRFLAAELTREQIFLTLHKELPYSVHVDTESWEERPDGSAKVNQVIYVLRESHKAIIVGRAGAMLKNIGAAARTEMAKNFGFTVHLFLFVKVKPDWQESPESYEAMGLNFRK